ncbi:c-type cytochrome [Thiocystis violascens]|uniref:Cytochrome c553 n=1 Tax=Thiocystis violascens (strain ATCC 17096 / DSM 198 / 6111) TaxID=765911 RepID=I3Y9N2_THIV6|nr:c-type cytochrome [Thiocystis violascens]AFL73700.1 cytochrome c553 [Thiocystis violascens DSM 198]
MRHRAWLSMFALGLLTSLNLQAGGVRSPSMLANTCAGCHGTNGASAGTQMPSIGGMDNGYLFSVLSDYKFGVRPSTIMGRIMKGYSDQEIWAIAAFFGEQPWVSTDQVAVADRIHAGREIHERQCESCHEDGGRGQHNESPRMAGQWSGYLRYALEGCREIGRRCSPLKMGARVMQLSDAEIESLARFYESEK